MTLSAFRRRAWRLSAMLVASLPMIVASSPSVAQERTDTRGYCAARPGMGTTPCTIAPGRLSVEIAGVDWERDRSAGQRTDSLLFGDAALRLGVTDTVEVLAQATPFGVLHTRDADGNRSTGRGSGDVTLGTKVNLKNPDGSGFSLSVLAFGTLPVGSKTFGAGDWAAGLLVPMSLSATDTISLQLTPEFDLAADSDGVGRHPAYNLIAGAGFSVADGVSITHELAVGRDMDPDGESTQAFYSTSLAWMPRDDLQLDAGTVIGLNDAAPDVRFYVGIARLF
ncbi:transporter [Sphingomonas adhaesiva]|uniref:transporter n=1 Tax=Sphingomonas adhaesiva TaxID=28212 RepID=UPI002FF61239